MIRAVARMNYLHSIYLKAGKISNDDMLYTLSLSALEPVRWVRRYEWRSLTDLERCATDVYWKSMGDAMHISYKVRKAQECEWKDGLHWLEKVEQWSLKYEEANMKYAKSNEKLRKSHLEVLFLNIPLTSMHLGQNVVSVIVGERMRLAMGFSEPPACLDSIIQISVQIRKHFIQHCFLPRPEFVRKVYISKEPDPKSGRYNSMEYLSYPWYVKPTFSSRWDPKAWILRSLGRKLPGDDQNSYQPDGYLFEEVGPASLIGKGIEDMEQTRQRLSQARRGRCPFGP